MGLRLSALPRRPLIVSAATAFSLGCAALPAAAGGGAPEVTPMVATAVTTTAATIEVGINPEGKETSYEIWLECREAGGSCEPVGAPQRQVAVLGAPTGEQTVSAAVSGLQPGSYYRYGVIATNSAGREGYLGVSFKTCPSTGPCPMQPAPGGESLWNIEGARRVGEEAPALEAQREALKREAEERLVREAAQWAARELAARQAGERAGREAAEREAAARAARCVVPRLRGDSLIAARRALAAAHCALGAVTAPRGRHGALVVTGQSVPRGRRLARGAKVSLTLRPRRA